METYMQSFLKNCYFYFYENNFENLNSFLVDLRIMKDTMSN